MSAIMVPLVCVGATLVNQLGHDKDRSPTFPALMVALIPGTPVHNMVCGHVDDSLSSGEGWFPLQHCIILNKGTTGQILPKTKCICSEWYLRTGEMTRSGSWDSELDPSQDSFHLPTPLFPPQQRGPVSLWVPKFQCQFNNPRKA